jgi:hypothetical protein
VGLTSITRPSVVAGYFGLDAVVARLSVEIDWLFLGTCCSAEFFIILFCVCVVCVVRVCGVWWCVCDACVWCVVVRV